MENKDEAWARLEATKLSSDQFELMSACLMCAFCPKALPCIAQIKASAMNSDIPKSQIERMRECAQHEIEDQRCLLLAS